MTKQGSARRLNSRKKQVESDGCLESGFQALQLPVLPRGLDKALSYPQIVHAARDVGTIVIIMGSHSRLTVYDVLLARRAG